MSAIVRVILRMLEYDPAGNEVCKNKPKCFPSNLYICVVKIIQDLFLYSNRNMKKTFLHPFALLIVFFGVPVCTLAIDTKDTRMLSQPAISRDHIAFIYAEDLWIANSDGTDPRRLTVDEGIESNPVFSPDGQWIAFNGQYDGNTDVYIIPVQGGIPKRLTWHPSADIVRGFTPDGKSVLFLSQRNEFTNRYFQLY